MRGTEWELDRNCQRVACQCKSGLCWAVSAPTGAAADLWCLASQAEMGARSYSQKTASGILAEFVGSDRRPHPHSRTSSHCRLVQATGGSLCRGHVLALGEACRGPKEETSCTFTILKKEHSPSSPPHAPRDGLPFHIPSPFRPRATTWVSNDGEGGLPSPFSQHLSLY